jgi:hypothetical protein
MKFGSAGAAIPPVRAAEVGSVRVAEWIALVFLGLLFAAPFLLPVHRLPQPAFDAEWLAATLLAGTAIALGLLKKRAVTLQWPLPVWLGAMVAIASVQYLLGALHYSSQLVVACLYAFAILAAYWVGRALLAHGLFERSTNTMAWALIVGSVLSVLIQWMQLCDVKGLPEWLFFEILDPWYRTRPFGNLAQANLLATYFIWSLCGILFLSLRSMRPGVALVLVFVVATGLALTRSRLGLVFSIAVLAAFWLPTALRPATVRARAALTAALAIGYLVGAGAVALLVEFQGGAVDNAVQRFSEAGGLSIRLVMWRDAFKVAATAPWVGVGFGDYAAHQYWIAAVGSGVEGTTKVHNVVLQTAAELGWPMALALVALGAWWLAAQWRERAAASETAFVMALLVVMGIHSLLEWPLSSMHFLIPTALLFALAEPRIGSERGAFAVDSRLLVAMGVGGLLLALPMKLEFDDLSEVTAKVESERHSKTGITEATIMRLLALGESARLRMYAEDQMVTIRAPTSVEANDAEIDRHERLLILGANPRLIARLVILYAKAGRMDESVRNAERLLAFDTRDYADLSAMILKAVEPLGAAADPLRKQLAAGRPS